MLGNSPIHNAENIFPTLHPPKLVQGIEKRQAEADRIFQRGVEQHWTGQFQDAIQSLEQALGIYLEIGDVAGEARSLMNLGQAYRYLGQYERAIEFYQQSLAIHREIGDVAGEAKSLKDLGVVYYSQGQYELAIEFYQQSLAIAREIGDVAGEGRVLMNLGIVYDSLGQYEKAIEVYHQSLAIAREIGDLEQEANTLSNLGVVCEFLGQYERAIDFLQQSLAINREIGNRNEEANSLNNLGIVYDSQGQYEKAIEFYQQSLAIMREIGNVAGEARSLMNLGSAYHFLGQERAIDFFRQSLIINREIGNVAGEAKSLRGLGIACVALGQYEGAVEFYQQSLAISREIGDMAEEAITLSNLGATFLLTENFAAAEQHLFAAIEVYEILRGDLTNDEDKISIFDTQTNSYHSLQQALIAQNKIEIALEIAERGRARAFVELIAQHLHGKSAEEFIFPAPPPLAELQQVARIQNAVLVEYSIVFDEFLYIWVIQPTGDIVFRQVDLDTLDTSVTELVTEFRDALGVREVAIVVDYLSSEEFAALQTSHLQELHQLLIEPIADLLPTHPEFPVIFIPHRELFLVPFPALVNAEGEYLIENHTILTAPSIQVLDLLGQNHRNRTPNPENLLIVGNPTMPRVWNPDTDKVQHLSRLPGAENEAVAIADFFNTEPLLGDDATEAVVTQRMTTAQIIHLATHGLLDYGSSEEIGVRDFPGAIALAEGNAEDGLLTAAEVLKMELQAELVVLSACNTGRGKLSSDGVIGLSRALIGAGVSNVIVSLWSVPDDSTADLMREFYQQWQATGNKAQSLRQAMLTTMKAYPEPSYWAAFTLIGETR